MQPHDYHAGLSPDNILFSAVSAPGGPLYCPQVFVNFDRQTA